MNIRATVHGRRIELPAPDEIPDGTDVLVEVTPLPCAKVGLEESEWRDDPVALADWEAWLATIQPLEFTVEEQAIRAEFDERMRQFNLDAVRRQMEEGTSA